MSYDRKEFGLEYYNEPKPIYTEVMHGGKDDYTVVFVFSRPGDATKYKYFIIKTGNVLRFINPFTGLKFPDEELSLYTLDTKSIVELEEEYDINRWTAAELKRTCDYLFDYDFDNNINLNLYKEDKNE